MKAKLSIVATAPKTCMRCGEGFWYGGKVCPACRGKESRPRRPERLRIVPDEPRVKRPKRDNPETVYRVALLDAMIREQRRAEHYPGSTARDAVNRLLWIAERFRDAVCDDEPVLAQSWRLRQL